MSASTERDVVRVRGVTGLLSIVPSCLGFHPADSVVLVGLSGPRRRVGPVARIDYGFYFNDPDGAAAQLGVMNKHVDTGYLLFYGGADVHDLAARMEGHGIHIVETAMGPNDPVQLDPRVHAEQVLNGQVVHSSREARRALVEYDPAAGLGAEERALIESMRTVKGRDNAIGARIAERHTQVPIFCAALRAVSEDAPDGEDAAAWRATVANLAAATTILAYRDGDGALAQMAVDRALAAQPAHRLAHLMLAVMAAGMPPADLDELVGIEEGTKEDE